MLFVCVIIYTAHFPFVKPLTALQYAIMNTDNSKPIL